MVAKLQWNQWIFHFQENYCSFRSSLRCPLYQLSYTFTLYAGWRGFESDTHQRKCHLLRGFLASLRNQWGMCYWYREIIKLNDRFWKLWKFCNWVRKSFETLMYWVENMHCYLATLESGINIPGTFINFWLFSRGYALISEGTFIKFQSFKQGWIPKISSVLFIWIEKSI